MSNLFQRKVVSLRLSEDLKKRIDRFFRYHQSMSMMNLHCDYTFSFAIRNLLLTGVISLEEELGIDSELSQVQIRTFKKRASSKESAFDCHVSCSMPVFLINRVCGVASEEGVNRAEGFRLVLERGLRILL